MFEVDTESTEEEEQLIAQVHASESVSFFSNVSPHTCDTLASLFPLYLDVIFPGCFTLQDFKFRLLISIRICVVAHKKHQMDTYRTKTQLEWDFHYILFKGREPFSLRNKMSLSSHKGWR